MDDRLESYVGSEEVLKALMQQWGGHLQTESLPGERSASADADPSYERTGRRSLLSHLIPC
mgnify:FL=1